MEINETINIIKNKYNFEIPDYIITEMQECPNNINNIIALIGLAKINGRITKKQANILIKNLPVDLKLITNDKISTGIKN